MPAQALLTHWMAGLHGKNLSMQSPPHTLRALPNRPLGVTWT